MELKYGYYMIIGGALMAVLLILWIFIGKKKSGYKGGKKIANSLDAQTDRYLKKRLRLYRILTGLLLVFSLAGILFGSYMLSTPISIEKTQQEEYNRDIILCIDISSSVDELNMKLVDELKETVDSLHGDRFGIVIFNTSPVLLVPLTDDYDYVIEQLEMIRQSLAMRIRYYQDYYLPDDWYYLNEYISSGTLIGSDERGSSLIGDGLAASVYNFSKLDEEERTRIVIFTTDNVLEGEPFVTLDQAADICISKKVLVYGIGTKEMEPANMQEMRAAVEKTGGIFFLEEESGTFSQIVAEIEKQSKSKSTKTTTEIHETRHVETPFIFMFISIFMMLGVAGYTKR